MKWNLLFKNIIKTNRSLVHSLAVIMYLFDIFKVLIYFLWCLCEIVMRYSLRDISRHVLPIIWGVWEGWEGSRASLENVFMMILEVSRIALCLPMELSWKNPLRHSHKDKFLKCHRSLFKILYKCDLNQSMLISIDMMIFILRTCSFERLLFFNCCMPFALT